MGTHRTAILTAGQGTRGLLSFSTNSTSFFLLALLSLPQLPAQMLTRVQAREGPRLLRPDSQCHKRRRDWSASGACGVVQLSCFSRLLAFQPPFGGVILGYRQFVTVGM